MTGADQHPARLQLARQKRCIAAVKFSRHDGRIEKLAALHDCAEVPKTQTLETKLITPENATEVYNEANS